MPTDQNIVTLALIGGIGLYFLIKQKQQQQKEKEAKEMKTYNFDFSSIPENFGEMLNKVGYGDKPIIIPM
jgi:hypothetical protein